MQTKPIRAAGAGVYIYTDRRRQRARSHDDFPSVWLLCASRPRYTPSDGSHCARSKTDDRSTADGRPPRIYIPARARRPQRHVRSVTGSAAALPDGAMVIATLPCSSIGRVGRKHRPLLLYYEFSNN